MLTLTNVRKSFGKTVAANGLSLSVRKGDLVSVGIACFAAGTRGLKEA